jgi:hypothetical protein
MTLIPAYFNIDAAFLDWLDATHFSRERKHWE